MHAGRRWTTRAVGAALVVTVAGCGIGAYDPEVLDAEVRSRSGGASANAIDAVVTGVERELGPDPEVLDLTITFGEVRATVTAPVPDGVDRLSFTRERLDAQEPQEVDPSAPGPAPVPLSAFALDRVEEMADAALEEVAARDAWVANLQVRRDPDGMTMSVESVRSPTVIVAFTADGDLVPVLR